MGVCNCSIFCCMLHYVHSSIVIILMGKRELVALLNLSSWCLVIVEWLFLAVPWGCLRFVIVVFPDHTHLLFFMGIQYTKGLTHCIWETPKWVILQTIKTQMKCRIMRQGLNCFKRLSGKKYNMFENCNQTLLDMYNRISQVYCIKPEGRIHYYTTGLISN